ncbi:hypothetical protein KKD03_03770 [Patescibacteria group bacterium]|nr:hypothetical protein [Patescibacteria group bacterium]
MKKRKVVLSATYSLGQISVGLILHPYQTMQALVREKVFIWMSLLPSLVLMSTTLLWKIAVVPLVRFVFSCSELSGMVFSCDWLDFVSNAIAFYCIYWQLLLFYLLIRFNSAYRNKL